MTLHQTPSSPLRIAILGDSTVCDFPPERGGLAGWGQLLIESMDASRVTIHNFAQSGRSSKDFFSDIHWQQYQDMNPPAAVLLIQFGSNDNMGTGKGPLRETTPAPMPATLPAEGLGQQPADYFRHNLSLYVSTARQKGARPILVTPMERYHLDAKNKVIQTNLPYAQAMQAVGQAMAVPVIDLNAYSVHCYNQWDESEARSHHFIKADGSLDRSHYNAKGARTWAQWIATELAKADERLAAVVKR